MNHLFCFVLFLLFGIFNVHSYISRNSYYLLRRMMISDNVSDIF